MSFPSTVRRRLLFIRTLALCAAALYLSSPLKEFIFRQGRQLDAVRHLKQEMEVIGHQDVNDDLKPKESSEFPHRLADDFLFL